MLKKMYEKEVTLLHKLLPSLTSQNVQVKPGEENITPGTSSNIDDNSGAESDSATKDKGVPIVILHEGGYCATIVALLATKRLIFDTVIPEQIIMMDQQQQPIAEDHPQSLLRRFSSHREMSGREVSDPRECFNGKLAAEEAESHMPGVTGINDDSVVKNGGDEIANTKDNFTEVPSSEEELKERRAGGNAVKRKAFGKDAGKVKKSKVKQEGAEQEGSSVDSNSVASSKERYESTLGKDSDFNTQGSLKQDQFMRDGASSEGAILTTNIELEKMEMESTDDFSGQEADDSCQPGELSSTEGEDSEAAVTPVSFFFFFFFLILFF